MVRDLQRCVKAAVLAGVAGFLIAWPSASGLTREWTPRFDLSWYAPAAQEALRHLAVRLEPLAYEGILIVLERQDADPRACLDASERLAAQLGKAPDNHRVIDAAFRGCAYVHLNYHLAREAGWVD